MDPPRPAVTVALLLSLLACQSPRPGPPTIQAAIVRSLAALPWTHGQAGGSALCPTLAPCDTLWLEPRIVRLPHPAPVFFVPDARPTLLVLDGSPAEVLPGLSRLGRAVRYGSWTECLAQRHDAAWPTYRRVCVTLGVAGDTVPGDTVQIALQVLSPSEGLQWPRIRLVAGPDGWQTTLVSMGGE